MYQRFLKFLLFSSFIISGSILPEGFSAGTLIKTPCGYAPIEQLKENDLILSYNIEAAHHEITRVIRISKRCSNVKSSVNVLNAVIQADADQLFYCPLREKLWVEAQQLTTDDFLFNDTDVLIAVDEASYAQAPSDVYVLSVEKNHNFFVTHHDILVHNFALPLIGGALKFIAENFAFKIGVSVLGLGAGVILNKAGGGKREIYFQNQEQKSFLESSVRSSPSCAGSSGGPEEPENKDNSDEVHPSTPVGRRGLRPEARVQKDLRKPTVINGREYSKHAIERMQERGYTPSVVENGIRNEIAKTGQRTGTLEYFDSINNLTIITSATTGAVVTIF